MGVTLKLIYKRFLFLSSFHNSIAPSWGKRDHIHMVWWGFELLTII